MNEPCRKQRSSGARALLGLFGVVLFYSAPTVMADKTTEEAITRAENELTSSTVPTLEDLAGRLRREQYMYRILMPPDAEFTLRQSCGMVVFDPKIFPSTFTDGLIGEKIYDSPVYSIVLAEDPETREIVIANADGKEIAAIRPEKGYDPNWYLDMQYPDLYSGLYSQEEINRLKDECDPYRIQITLTLLPTDFVNTYAKAVAEEQAVLAEELAALNLKNPKSGGGIMMMMYQGTGMTNFFMDISRATNGMKVMLAYPDDYTNRVDFFTCPELIAGWWDLAVNATNVNSSTNFIEWVDVNASAHTPRFYNAGNAGLDSDSDGLTDAREMLMYHTNSATNDTDGDGLSDYEEVINWHTDPNNSDTNMLNVWITFPTDGSGKVWIP